MFVFIWFYLVDMVKFSVLDSFLAEFFSWFGWSVDVRKKWNRNPLAISPNLSLIHLFGTAEV